MSIITQLYYPRSLLSMDHWLQPGVPSTTHTSEMLDSFDEPKRNNAIGRNFQWLDKPAYHSLLTQSPKPKVPQKYRVILDCVGYSPKSIKIECKDFVLIVSAREEIHKDDDFSLKEFKKTYKLPETAQCDKLVSFLTDDGKLIIEMPLKETKVQPKSDLFPRITDTETSGKQVSMNFNVPESITPEKIQVNVKDRCLIIKAEDDEKLPEGESKLFYFKQILLPENTDFNALKCYFDNHQISITAPLNIEYKPIRSVPIECKPQQQLIRSDKEQSHQKSVEKE